MLFQWRAMLRPAVYVGVNLATRQPEFEPRWMSLRGDQVLFSRDERGASVFDCYWDPRQAAALWLRKKDQPVDGGWLRFDVQSPDRMTARLVPTPAEATRLLLLVHPAEPRGFSLRMYLAHEGGKGKILGVEIPDMVGGPGYFLSSLDPFAWADMLLPPLGLPLSYAAFDYSDLPFEGLTLTGATLDGVVMRRCTFPGAHLYRCSLKGAVLAGADLRGASTVDCVFDGADLSGAVLAKTPHPGASFAKAVLQDADLSGASLRGANLAGARLARANVAGTDLCGACLDGADLSGVDLRKALLDAKTTLRGARFAGADLSGLSLAGIDLSDAVFTGAKMEGTDLRHACLEGTDFSQCDLRATKFDPTPRFSVNPARRTLFRNAIVPYDALGRAWTALDLSGATIHALPVELSTADAPLLASQAILRGLELKDRVLEGAQMQDADLRGANLTRCVLDDADLTGARLGDPTAPAATTLSGASMFNTRMARAVLTGVDFSNAVFWGETATVEEATMPLVRFTGAFLAGMHFKNVPDLRGASFAGACLVNCDLTRCNLTPYEGASVSFVGACLQGADFTDASLNGALMLDAAVARKAGTLTVTIPVRHECYESGWDYTATVLPERATSATTRCPSGDSGPCTGSRLDSPNAPMHRWTAPACRPPT